MNKFQQSAHTASGHLHQTAENGVSYNTDRTVQSAPVQAAPVRAAPGQPIQNGAHSPTGQIPCNSVSQNSPRPTHHAPGQMAAHPIAQRDEELAQLFQQIRQLTGADITTLASHLQTSPEILGSFENGDFNAFPPWAETVRIVSSLTLLVNVDCEPILSRIAQKSHQPAPRHASHEPMPQNPQSAQPAQVAQPHHPQESPITQHAQPMPQSVANQDLSRSTSPARTTEKNPGIALASLKQSVFSKRNLSLATIPVFLVAAFFVATLMEQKNGLTGPLGNYAKAGWELFNWNSTTKDGLRWIKTSDPRSRKANKLPVYGEDG